MDVIPWIKGQHKGVRFFYETAVRNVLSAEQMKERPGGVGNSVAWLVWHVARSEDMIVNAILREQPQILLQDAWQEKLGIDATHIGTGLGDDEIGDFTDKLDPIVADDYWRTVAESTYEWLRTLEASDLDRIPDFDKVLKAIPSVLASGDSQGAIDFWNGRSVAYLLGGVVINHGYIHVGEMQAITGRLGEQGWF
jgi:hypothetical protein